MKTYRIRETELLISTWEVKADDEEDAFELHNAGESVFIEREAESTMDYDSEINEIDAGTKEDDDDPTDS